MKSSLSKRGNLMNWYENFEINNNIIISSRIRLARNLKNYPFNNFLDKTMAQNIIDNVDNAILSGVANAGQYFDFINLDEISNIDKVCMVENHSISLDFFNSQIPKQLIIEKDKDINIMINEEDHLRIQSIQFGDNIEKAFDFANKIDDLIGEKVSYAFDKDFGYLTSCLTNVGTGMRASFMLHIPMLEKYRQINDIANSISKFGMTIRGIYGEKSEALGGIYQISNQATLGKNEEQIICNLKNITYQIAEKEKAFRQEIKKESYIDILDSVYRSYGILKNCKKISNQEALTHLSNLWVGIYLNIFDKNLINRSIYSIIMKIQSANLMKIFPQINTEQDFLIYRAKIINQLI